MAAKTLYFKNVTVNGALSLQDGGTAPTAGLTTTGWAVGKIAASNFSLMAVGTEKVSGTFSTTDALATPAFTAASCWRSEQPFTGVFSAAQTWTMAFKLRAVTAAASQRGAVKVRVWKSTNPTGSGAVQLTTGMLTGGTTLALSTTASQFSTVNWVATEQAFNNEYLWVQCEWQITTAGTSNSADVDFYIKSDGRITTSDFAVPAADAWNVADKSAGMSLSGADKTATMDVGTSTFVKSTTTYLADNTGKRYAEFHFPNAPSGGGASLRVGLDTPISGGLGSANSFLYYSNGDIYFNQSTTGINIGAITSGDTICLAWDEVNGQSYFRKNAGPWNGSGAADPSANTGGHNLSVPTNTAYALAFGGINAVTGNCTIRTEAAEFAYQAPAGFMSWMGEAISALAGWNVNDKSPGTVTLSNGDKTATASSGGVRSTKMYTSGTAGKYYGELKVDAISSTYAVLLEENTAPVANGGPSSSYVMNDGTIYILNAQTGNSLGAMVAGDVMSIAWNSGAELVWFRRNEGWWNNSSSANPATGVGGFNVAAAPNIPYALGFVSAGSGHVCTLRTEKDEFTQSTPAGYSSWMGEPLIIPDAGTLAAGTATVAGAGNATHYGTGTLTSQSSTLTSNFAVSGSTGTGTLTAVAAGVPTNYVLYSEQLERVEWTRPNVTVVADNAMAPNGATAAETFTTDTNASSHGVYIATPIAFSNGDLTLSFHCRAGTGRWVQIYDNGVFRNFDIVNGVVGYASAGVVASSIINLGGGWYRCSLTYSIASGTSRPQIYFMDGDSPGGGGGHGTAGLSFHVWGVQAEKSATMGPYAPSGGTVGILSQTLVGVGIASWNATGALVAGAVYQNLLRSSEELRFAGGWQTSALTVTPDNILAPDGTLTAELWADTTSNAPHYIHQSPTSVAGVHTFSLYVKAGTLPWIQLYINAGAGFWANFNPVDGTLGNKAINVTSRSSAVGDGWYRIEATAVCASGPSTVYIFLLNSNTTSDNPTYIGNGATIYVWGAQLEGADKAGPYLKTTSSPVTVGTPVIITGAGVVTSPPVIGTGALTTGVAAVSSFGASASSGTAGGGSVVNTGAPMGVTFAIGQTTNPKSAQSFQSVGTTVSAVRLWFKKGTNISTVGNIIAKVFTSSGAPLDQIGVTSSPLDSTILTATETAYDFTFSPPVAVSLGVEYHIVAETTALDALAANCPQIGGRTPSQYAGGQWRYHDGSVWKADFSTYDLVTIIDQTIAGGLKPLTAALTGAGISQVIATGALNAFVTRTNVLPYSQNLDQWLNANIVVGVDATVAPNGSTTAERFSDNATLGHHAIWQPAITGLTGKEVTYSVYAKADTLQWLQLWQNIAPVFTANFDLVAGTVGQITGTNFTPRIEDAGNGWWRCSITWINQSNPVFYIVLKDADVAGFVGYTGTGKSLYLWGTQFEAAPAPTTYIQTGSTSVTVTVGSLLTSVGTSGSIQTSGALQATMPPLTMGNGVASSTGTAALASSAATIVSAGLGPSWVGTGTLTAVANSRGNFLLQSQTFHHAMWAKSDATIAADVTFSPPFDLTGTADQLTDTVANAPHYVSQSASVPLVPHTLSVYAKAVAGSTWLKLMMSAGAGYSANFNLVNGTIGNTGLGTTARITPVGNSWYRCSITSDVAFVSTTCNTYIFTMSTDTSATTYPGAGLSHYIWGAQLERSSAPTTYLPTVASAVTFTEVLTGAGTAAWSGTGTLTAQTAALTGAGTTTWAASGAMVAQYAATVAPGISSSAGTATLPSTAATMSGLGSAVTGVGGTGSFAAQSAIIVAAGISRSVGTPSAMVSQPAIIVAPGLVTALGAGVLPRAGALTSAVTGAGAVASVGTAAINAQAAVVNSSGISRWVATGTLPAQAADVDGAGVIIAAPSGTGALAAQASTVVSAGAGFWRATGTMPAGSSAIVAAGVARWSGTGAIAPSASAVAGVGVSSSSIVSAALFASTCSLNGFEGVTIVSGTGTLPAQSHVLDAVAISRSLGTGGLFDATSALAGAGLSGSVGLSPLVSQACVIASLGVSRSQGFGALPSPVSTLAGAGVIIAAPTGTGALDAQASEVIGVVVAEHVAAGVLSAQAADVTSIGLVRDPAFGTGALAPSAAVLDAVGNIGAAPSGVGVLAPYSASLNAQGIRQWAATGALASKPSTVAGVAGQGWIATGSLVAQAPAAIGTGVATWAAAGALPAGSASIAAAGLSRTTGTAPLAASRASVFGAEGEGVPIEGIGELQAQSRVLAGAGFGRSFGFGSLSVADSAYLSATGASASRGPGTLAAGRSDLEGTGAGLAQGVGALAAGAATLASTGGVARWVASGALQAGDPQLTGIFASGSRGTGALAVADPVATGLGSSTTVGGGALGSRPATVFGSAFLSTSGFGELEAQSRVIVGTGISLSRGTGALIEPAHALAGVGLSLAKGTGAIIAKPAKIAGFATLTAYGAGVLVPHDAAIIGDDLVVGAGVLDAAACEVTSAGDVGEYIPAAPDELPGSYPGTETWYGSVGGAPRVPSAWWLKDAA